MVFGCLSPAFVQVAPSKIFMKNFGSQFCVLYSANLCFFDKLQPIMTKSIIQPIMQPILTKKGDNNHIKR